MPDRTLLHWAPVLDRPQPRGTLDVTWRWKAVVGRARECEIVLNHPAIPSHHGHFVRLRNLWFVENYEGSKGVYIQGKRIFREPVRDEEVDFGMLVRFKFEVQPMPEDELKLREAIRADPFDAARYLVYADWLQERDDPLGALMVSPAPVGARWLGPLHDDGIGVTWRHGFLEKVTVRSSKSIFAKAGVFSEVLAHPLSAFLTTLEADAVLLERETPECSAEHWVDYLFESLLDNPPKSLRTLKVRLPRELGERFQGELKALKMKVPSLETPFEQLFTEGGFA